MTRHGDCPVRYGNCLSDRGTRRPQAAPPLSSDTSVMTLLESPSTALYTANLVLGGMGPLRPELPGSSTLQQRTNLSESRCAGCSDAMNTSVWTRSEYGHVLGPGFARAPPRGGGGGKCHVRRPTHTFIHPTPNSPP
jgi:hypothetical protein